MKTRYIGRHTQKCKRCGKIVAFKVPYCPECTSSDGYTKVESMAETKHTPGPVKTDTINYFEGNFGLTATQDPKTGEWILLREDRIRLGRVTDKIVAQHLIRRWKAAPMLLDACKAVEKCPHQNLSGSEYKTGVADGHRCAAIMVRAAIAAAEKGG